MAGSLRAAKRKKERIAANRSVPVRMEFFRTFLEMIQERQHERSIEIG